jgi:transcriptional regulator GlxA family with amidase domain
VEDATWEKLDEFRQQFPDIQLEDELFAQAGRDVMTGLHYSRKRPTSGSV